jgi:hypothetical protein
MLPAAWRRCEGRGGSVEARKARILDRLGARGKTKITNAAGHGLDAFPRASSLRRGAPALSPVGPAAMACARIGRHGKDGLDDCGQRPLAAGHGETGSGEAFRNV